MKRWLLAISLLAAGCTNSAPPTSAPGMATLRIQVIAEPKAGAPRPELSVSTFDVQAPHNSADFAKVDYADLSQIVVWVEPAAAAQTKNDAPPLTISLGSPIPPDSVSAVACVGQTLVLTNATGIGQTIYCVSDGNDFDLGVVAPGSSGRAIVRTAGTIEVLGDAAEQPLAVIEAAPTAWVKLAHAGDDLTFSNLPPGNYRIVSWHPRLPGSQTSVQLVADQIAEAQIHVGVNALPKVGSGQTP